MLTAQESHSLLEQFAALGYIEPIGSDVSAAAARTQRENKWSLARSYSDGGRLESALPLLEELHEQSPERMDCGRKCLTRRVAKDCECGVGPPIGFESRSLPVR
jgi:hypothetical protein